MNFLNCIGEFFLFRWLFSKFKKSTIEHDAHAENLGASIDRDSKFLNGNHNEDTTPIDDAIPPITDDLIDNSDSSEDLDDLDIFMRNNSGNNRSYLHHGDYDSDYHSSSHNSGSHDWDSGSYSQSYDYFHDERDDYDMMDDDF